MLNTRCVLAAGLAGVAVSSAAAQSSNDDEVRAVVSEMLAEAQSRSSLLAGGSAGHDGAFFLASDDGAFRLNISGFYQFRYYADFRDDANTVGSTPGDDFESGFQMRRMKLGFAGNISKDWSYNVLLNVSRTNGAAILQDAYVDYAISDKWKLRVGQSKIPLLREELTGDQYQLAAERSLVNSAFTQDRSQMVQLTYAADPLNVRVAFSDGLNSDNTDFTAGESSSFIIGGEADWAVTARLEYLLSGQAKQFSDFTAEPDGPFGALLGAAIHYQQSPNTNVAADTDRDTLEYTIDASIEGSGWNLYGAFVGRHDDFRAAGGDTEFDDFGVVAQGGFRLDKKWEPFVRYEGFFFDSDRGLNDDTHNFLTVGVNHYIAGHALKATADVVFPFEDTADLVSVGVLPDTGVGLLGSSEDGEVVVRLQFQMLF
jgi:hypothetical protein